MDHSPLICVVDEDASVREALFGLLRAIGYAVLAFGSRTELMAEPRAAQARCLIVDPGLPRVAGQAVLELLRWRPELDVIAITMSSERALYELLLAAGARDCVHKPFLEERLLSAVQRLRGDPPASAYTDAKQGSKQDETAANERLGRR